MTAPGTPPPTPPGTPPIPPSPPPEPPPADSDTEKAELKKKLEVFEKAERAREKAEADKQKADKDKADAESLKRGEIEPLLVKEKAETARLASENADLKIRGALMLEVGAHKPADTALEDILTLFPRDGLKIGADGKIEGFAEKIKAFKAEKPHLFQAGAAEGAETPPATGLPGTRPKSAPTGDVVKEVIRQNLERAKPENNRLLQLKRKGA